MTQQEIQKQEKNMPKSPTEQELFQQASNVLEAGKFWLNKSYLPALHTYDVQPLEQNSLNLASDVRLFRIGRVCLENKQSMLESLTAVYQALWALNTTVFLLLDSENAQTDLYLGVKNAASASTSGALLRSALNGHFSGSEYKTLNNGEMHNLFEKFKPNSGKAVSSLTTVPSLAVSEREHFMQGLERFIDASEMSEHYQAIFIAEPVSSQELEFAQLRYENMSSQISPLVKQQLSFNYSDSQSLSTTISKSITESFTQSESSGTNSAEATGVNEQKGRGFGYGFGMGIAAGGKAGIPFVAEGSINVNVNANINFNQNESVGKSLTKTIGTSQVSTAGKSTGKTDMETEGEANTTTYGNGISFDSVNKSIQQISEQLDVHLERIKACRSFGGWKTASYFLADYGYMTISLASIVQGVLRGETSYVENSAINTWEADKSSSVLQWISNLQHPQFDSPIDSGVQLKDLTPATLISGKEMAIQLALPRRSTSTVTVVEAVPFGRRIQNVNGVKNEGTQKVVDLGKVRHLWQDLPQKVELDVEKLSGHIFVTGSTGSGKSNTVYQLLDQLNKNDVKFLVIEPAKGEYKNVFGHRDDVRVFGTNPKQAELLRINPFKFPASGDNAIHVLEHIDRLIEIFNVCWTMYDAMPAMLKKAMLEAYRASGWNLETSCNAISDELFPNFSDLLAHLREEINKSEYSDDIKRNYKGALVTRVESLTNGLNKQIFSSDEIDNAVLFDGNVVVDLSRVGSQETKSLIMGILVMRLGEYRMATATKMNEDLKHITVLEEAHNILRARTGEGAGGSNMAAKSVEMLSNAIAEMRTFGEGFIIADQSPSAVDISAIRNTNTKIIMRLPDETDRRLAGKASGVSDEQLEEIAKLPKGVAVVYQNDWLEPVLCSVHHFKADEKAYKPNLIEHDNDRKAFNTELAKFLFNKRKNLDIPFLEAEIVKSEFLSKDKAILLDALNALKETGRCQISPASKLFDLLQLNEELNRIARLTYQDQALFQSHIEQFLAAQFEDMSDFKRVMQSHTDSIWKNHYI
ncbi:TPA: ATPase, T2SS/T4P/T4SS family [Mannheimia haemolytica]